MSERRVYWLKTSDDFMQSKEMRALRRMDRGAPDIYLRILTKSLQSKYTISHESYFNTLEEELADQIREEDAGAVKKVIDFLKRHKLMIETGAEEYYLPQAEKMSQSEGLSAERMRNYRGRKTQSDAYLSQSDAVTSQRYDNKSKNKNKSKNNSSSARQPPTQEEVEIYFQVHDMKSDPKTFFNYNQTRGWKDIEDWQAAAALWETREKEHSDRQRGQRCDNQFNSFEQRNDSGDLDKELLKATRQKYSAELGTSCTGSREMDTATGSG